MCGKKIWRQGSQGSQSRLERAGRKRSSKLSYAAGESAGVGRWRGVSMKVKAFAEGEKHRRDKGIGDYKRMKSVSSEHKHWQRAFLVELYSRL